MVIKEKQRGITLIALIVTIVVLLILASIAIGVLGDNGILVQSQEAKEGAEILDEKKILGLSIETAMEKNKFGEIEKSALEKELDKNIGEGKYTLDATTIPDKFIVTFIESKRQYKIDKKGNINEYIGNITINVEEKNIDSITISVIAIAKQEMPEPPEYEYYIKKTTENDYPSTPYKDSESSHTYTGLEENTSYDIKVITKDKEGNVIEGEERVKTIRTLKGNINFGIPQWSSGVASVTISSNTTYTIQYQINDIDGLWETIENGGTISNLQNRDTVYARLTDGAICGEYASITILDAKGPTVEVMPNGSNSRSITVDVAALDSESGMPPNPIYKYYIKKSSENNYPNQPTYEGTDFSYTFDKLTQNTNYDIKVTTTDYVGNVGEGVTLNITTITVPGGLQSGVITFGTPQWNGPKASVTVNTTQTGYTIEYQINGISGTWTPIENGGTISNINNGDTVYARLTDGVNYGDYASITVLDSKGPTVNVTASGSTTRSITASVTASDNESGMPANPIYKYYIKKSTESNYPSTPKYEGTNTSYTFNGLTQNTSYDIKVTTTDNVGNIGEGTALNKTTGTVPGGLQSGAITFGIPQWSGGKASVTISTTYTQYTIEYQINSISGTWTTIANGGTVSNLNNGDTVYARLTDGVNYGDYASITILDSKGPTVNVTTNTSTTRSITANVTASDSESGMPQNPIYKYYIKKSSESSYPSTPTYEGTNTSYTFDGLTQTTSYDIKVTTTDNVGNIGEGTALNKTTGTVPSGLQSGVITFGTPQWSGGKASVTISTTYTQYTIEYQINSVSGTWTTIANGGTVSGLSHGDTVYARLTDGVNYGDYASVTILDSKGPTVNVTVNTTTTRSITVNVTASDSETGLPTNPIYKYYIKKSTESSYPSTPTYEGTNTSYTFDGLTQTTSYDIKVTTTDNVGNIGEGTALNKTTGTVPSGLQSGVITFGTPQWSGGKASVTISTTYTQYTIEYQINSISGTWTTIANGGTVSGLSHGDTVYARLTDGVNAGEYASVTISDGVSPTVSSFTVTNYATTTISVSVSAVDNQSGIKNYTYQYKKSTATSYTTAATSTSTTYTYSGLADGTTYNLRVVVTDNAGNQTTKDVTQTTVTANTAPTFTTQGYLYTKSTSSITIRATATDANGDSLTYKLYTGTSSSNLTLAATSSATSSGTAVSLAKSSLSQYTTYYFRMDVTDGKATTTGTVSSARTYCSGTTYKCTTSLCTAGSSSTCSTCDGEGYKACTTCSGTGKIPCPDSPVRTNTTTVITCPSCGGRNTDRGLYKCYTCGVTGVSTWCKDCKKNVEQTDAHKNSKISCTTCGGDGLTSTRCTKCSGTGTRKVYCDHGYAKSHRYCSHYDSTTKTSHYYCSHNYNGVQH